MAITRPTSLLKPFAAEGGKNAIPVDSQIGVGDSGGASYTDGFPPLTRTPIAAGGIPPKGLDMNGILYEATAHIQFLNAGGQAQFDSALVAAIGGYPVGAVLQSNDGQSAYVNVLAGNTDNFNTTPASIGVSWLPYAGIALKQGIIPGATFAEVDALTEDEGPIIVTDHGGAVYVWNGSAYAPLIADETYAGSMKRATAALAQGLTDDATALTPKKLADAFKDGNQSLGANGYQKLPGGLIMQWGSGTSSGTGSLAITFPVAFPTDCVSISGIPVAGAGAGIACKLLTSAPSPTGATLAAFNTGSGSGASGIPIFWSAVGY
jgi:hypothetical protein